MTLRNEILAAIGDATSAIVSDALDKLDLLHQALDPAVRPLWPAARVVGWAFPILVRADPSTPEKPYDGEMSALDALGPGDVPLFAVEPGLRAAAWGELFSCGAIGRGARGAVVDGLVRDARQTESLGFPTFARGLTPLDTYRRSVVSHYGVEALVAGVRVCPGDLVVGDVDGVVIVPAAVIDNVVTAVQTKRRLENAARDDLKAGVRIREVWDRYRVF
jgi:regulator of RNase E activity RraA